MIQPTELQSSGAGMTVKQKRPSSVEGAPTLKKDNAIPQKRTQVPKALLGKTHLH